MDCKRKCIGCNSIIERSGLIKITKSSADGMIYVNPNSKIFGRSVYLCYNKYCIENAFKKNKLSKALKTSLSEELKGKLIDLN